MRKTSVISCAFAVIIAIVIMEVSTSATRPSKNTYMYYEGWSVHAFEVYFIPFSDLRDEETEALKKEVANMKKLMTSEARTKGKHLSKRSSRLICRQFC